MANGVCQYAGKPLQVKAAAGSGLPMQRLDSLKPARSVLFRGCHLEPQQLPPALSQYQKREQSLKCAAPSRLGQSRVIQTSSAWSLPRSRRSLVLVVFVRFAGVESRIGHLLFTAVFATSVVLLLILLKMLDYPFEGALTLSNADFVKTIERVRTTMSAI